MHVCSVKDKQDKQDTHVYQGKKEIYTEIYCKLYSCNYILTIVTGLAF